MLLFFFSRSRRCNGDVETPLRPVPQVRLHLPDDLKPADKRKACLGSLREVMRRFPDGGWAAVWRSSGSNCFATLIGRACVGVPLLDPVEDMNIRTERAQRVVLKLQTLERR
jgi:hypothetical protein